ncbi:beta-lactamase/transpeptidase-like protein [Sordaria sp. MPI-SDFR-AT-0083]|nr:beta-lactamase/transpeptidase-like protein [Sordaria sp. MPI-SDFR-AT-0083]
MAPPTYTFETIIQKAVNDGIVPGVVLYARNKDGTLNYSHATGYASLSPTHPRPMTPHTILALASMTKLLTSICILQLLDSSSPYKSQFPLGLDTPVTDPDSYPETYLPDLASLPILSPTVSDPFATRTRSKHITVRHLLTHSSGCGYTFLQPPLTAWQEWKLAQENKKPHLPLGTAFAQTVPEQFSWPLLFEPGEGWAYGCGIDWVGWFLEKVTGKTLDEWMQESVVKKLGLEKGSLGFYPERVWPSEEQEKRERVADMGKRVDNDLAVAGEQAQGSEGEGGGHSRTRHIDTPQLLKPADRGAFGGQGGFADLSAYCEVVYSLLVDDERLLTKETARLLFKGQLKEKKAKTALNENMKTPQWVVGYVEEPAEGKGLVYDWSAGGLLVDEPGKKGDEGRWRRRGYLGWGGIFNLNWFVDREAGVCGVFGAQTLDPADPLIEPLIKDFEREIFEKYGAK